MPKLTFGFCGHAVELYYIESDTYDPVFNTFVKSKSPRGPEKVCQDIEMVISPISMFCGTSNTYKRDIKIVRYWTRSKNFFPTLDLRYHSLYSKVQKTPAPRGARACVRPYGAGVLVVMRAAASR